ncbi:MAG: hypothetical protein RL481_1966, partial [Pseudomonadota bacterium]
QAVELVARMKAARADIAIGADIIAGFPTEDDAMFANSLNMTEHCDIVHGHIFPYSPKEGTPAARMPQIPTRTIKARAKALRECVAEQRNRWLAAQMGKTKSVLVENSGRTGHAEDFSLVELPEDTTPGAILDVRISDASNGKLQGAIVT